MLDTTRTPAYNHLAGAPEAPTPVIVDTSRSPFARLRPIPAPAFRLTDRFWAPRLRTNAQTTLPALYRMMEEKGRLDNFRRAAGKKDVPFQGVYYFNDTDVYKWLEAACWALAAGPELEELHRSVEAAIDVIGDAQDASGYLNTYFSVDRAADRWTNFDLHEMYCAGHLFQAAVAHYRATRSTRLLEIARRLADHICDRFGPAEQGKEPRLDAHAEVEMALVELFRAIGNPRYLSQAQFFLSARGHGLLGRPYRYFDPDYAQDHSPFRELDRVTGHAVRMMYLDCGATDIYLETGESALKAALDRQWANMTERKLYVTGSVGACGDGEAFGRDYYLPSSSAYAETCAAIGCFMWNWRMLLATADARHADLMERILYNGLLAGVSLDGTRYFYENPLADDGKHRRQDWFECMCCPPNLARLLAALPGYFASVSDEGVWIHLYADGDAAITLPDGERVEWTVSTDYPWDGQIEVAITAAPRLACSFHLRVPGWAEDCSLQICGRPSGFALQPGSYARVTREWRRGDTLSLHLPMPIRRLVGHPYVVDTCGRVALMRGPLVYCVEQADNPDAAVPDLRLPAGNALEAKRRPELLGGVMTLEGDACAVDLSGWSHALYLPEETAPPSPRKPARMTAIPYYAWANRTPGPMAVWIPTE